jgi:hypothetical protein
MGEKSKVLMLVALLGLCGGGGLFVSTAQADLVGLWRFDANVDPQPDSSSFDNDADVVEATWVNDPNPDRGGVMQFEGQGDSNPQQWLEVPDSESLSIEVTGLTIAAWANFAQFDTWNSIMGKTGANSRNKPSPYDLYTDRGGRGNLRFYVGSGDGAITFVDSFDPPEAETWVHIAVTLDEEGNVFHYLNGEANGEGFVDREATPLIDEDTNLFIGSRYDGTTNMDGLLDDVAVFNQALTQAQVMTIMGGDFSAFGVGGGGIPGDFNNDMLVNEADIDALTATIKAGGMDRKFDVNQDGAVNSLDRNTWVNGIKNTWFGDSNLDGEFNSSDFVQVFTRGEYEDNVPSNSGWGDGDWDGSCDFDSADFVKAFTEAGYEKGPRAAVNGVPEPAAWSLLMMGILSLGIRRRR